MINDQAERTKSEAKLTGNIVSSGHTAATKQHNSLFEWLLLSAFALLFLSITGDTQLLNSLHLLTAPNPSLIPLSLNPPGKQQPTGSQPWFQDSPWNPLIGIQTLKKDTSSFLCSHGIPQVLFQCIKSTNLILFPMILGWLAFKETFLAHTHTHTGLAQNGYLYHLFNSDTIINIYFHF